MTFSKKRENSKDQDCNATYPVNNQHDLLFKI